MYKYKVTMQHNEESLLALSRMQYDLFCKSNRIIRSLLSLLFIILGLAYASAWWGILLIAYGCYLTTSTYSAANHTAHKLANRIKDSGCSFPCSEYRFEEDLLRVIALPEQEELEPLPYSSILRMGEDAGYFYIFRDSYGGYMVPKDALGEQVQDFSQFMAAQTGLSFHSRQAPILRLISKFFPRRT